MALNFLLITLRDISNRHKFFFCKLKDYGAVFTVKVRKRRKNIYLNFFLFQSCKCKIEFLSINFFLLQIM